MKTILRPDQMPLMRPMPMEDTDSLRMWRLEEEFKLPFRGGFLVCNAGYPVTNDRFLSDLVSIPPFFRRIYSPTGYLFLAGLFHDHCFKHGFYYFQPFPVFDVVTKVLVDQLDSDNLFREIAGIYYPEHKIKTWVAYKALRVGGHFAWNEYRKAEKYV